jgi:hypothetical protein
MIPQNQSPVTYIFDSAVEKRTHTLVIILNRITDKMDWTCGTRDRRENIHVFGGKACKELDNFEDLGLDVMIILNYMLKK